MHAADVAETLPIVRPDEDALSAIRMVARQGLPGLAVSDEGGNLAACLPPIELLRLMLPRYVRGEQPLARVFEEERADKIAAGLIGTPVREMLGEAAAQVPVARPEATVVELADTMIREGCPLVVVELPEVDGWGVVTVEGLLAGLVAAAEGSAPG